MLSSQHIYFREFLTLVFNGILYTQINGVAMGSPLGPVLANIFLAHLENSFMTKHDNFPLFYCRYVDDTFCIFKSREDALSFFQYVNTIHANINFTMEEEVNGKISFLDTVVVKQNNGLLLGMYTKPNATGQYFNILSLVPSGYKIGLMKCLIG